MQDSNIKNYSMLKMKKYWKYNIFFLAFVIIYILLMIFLFFIYKILPIEFLFFFSFPFYIVFILQDLVALRFLENGDINENNFSKRYEYVVKTASSYQKLSSLFFTMCFSAIVFLYSFFQNNLQEISIIILYFVISFLIFLFITIMYYNTENKAHEIKYYFNSLSIKIEKIMTLEILVEILRNLLYFGIFLLIGSILLIFVYIIFLDFLFIFGIFSFLLLILIQRIEGRASKKASYRDYYEKILNIEK